MRRDLVPGSEFRVRGRYWWQAFRDFEKLDVWQMARKLANAIYASSSSGAFARDFVLRDQIRRAAVSIISKIAEGFERGGNTEFVQYLSIAKGSVGEVRAQLYIALDQGYFRRRYVRAIASIGD